MANKFVRKFSLVLSGLIPFFQNSAVAQNVNPSPLPTQSNKQDKALAGVQPVAKSGNATAFGSTHSAGNVLQTVPVTINTAGTGTVPVFKPGYPTPPGGGSTHSAGNVLQTVPVTINTTGTGNVPVFKPGNAMPSGSGSTFSSGNVLQTAPVTINNAGTGTVQVSDPRKTQESVSRVK